MEETFITNGGLNGIIPLEDGTELKVVNGFVVDAIADKFPTPALDIQVGKLTIRSQGSEFFGSSICLNGQSLPVNYVKIEGSVNDPWTVTLAFIPARN